MADDSTSFEVVSGAGRAPVEPVQERRAAVQAAFDGLLQIRRLMNTTVADPLAVPAEWERHQAVRAVALVLEASEIAPSAVDCGGHRVATGYCVRETEAAEVTRVEWLGPAGSGAAYEEQDALRRCADALRQMGWEVLEYRGPRRRRYLEVEPPGRCGYER